MGFVMPYLAVGMTCWPVRTRVGNVENRRVIDGFEQLQREEAQAAAGGRPACNCLSLTNPINVPRVFGRLCLGLRSDPAHKPAS
jgi:hypothetical protein